MQRLRPGIVASRDLTQGILQAEFRSSRRSTCPHGRGNGVLASASAQTDPALDVVGAVKGGRPTEVWR